MATASSRGGKVRWRYHSAESELTACQLSRLIPLTWTVSSPDQMKSRRTKLLKRKKRKLARYVELFSPSSPLYHELEILYTSARWPPALLYLDSMCYQIHCLKELCHAMFCYSRCTIFFTSSELKHVNGI